jgi:hypothetical protein
MTTDAPEASRCPWCSALLPEAAGATCPACGAALHGDPPAEIPGLTQVDPEVLRRAAPKSRPRSPGWLSRKILGVDPLDDEAPAGPMAPVRRSDPASPAVAQDVSADALGGDATEPLEPPSDAVRREMRRIELEARAAAGAREAASRDAAAASAIADATGGSGGPADDEPDGPATS